MPLPKAELIRQADSICDQTNRLLKGYGRPEAGPGIIGTFRQVGQYLRTQLGRLESLPATPADRAVLQQHLVDTTRRKLALVDALIARTEQANGDTAAIGAALRDFYRQQVDTRPDDQALVAYGYRACVNANL